MATIWTQADFDALKAAIRDGVLSCQINGRTVTYQSLPEMRSLLAEMRRELVPPATSRVAGVRKGV